jgi:hypothetical protein
LVVVVSLAGALWSAWERQHQDPWHKLLAQVRQAMRKAGITIPAQSSPRQLMQVLQSLPDVRLRRPDLQRWLLRLEALRYAAPSAHAGRVEAGVPSSKSHRSGADVKRQLATLQRDIQRLLPLRTP